MGYSRKKQTGVEDTPLELFIFLLLTLPLEIPDKRKLHPRIFHKIMLDPFGNSTLFFLGHTWKFHFVFN